MIDDFGIYGTWFLIFVFINGANNGWILVSDLCLVHFYVWRQLCTFVCCLVSNFMFGACSIFVVSDFCFFLHSFLIFWIEWDDTVIIFLQNENLVVYNSVAIYENISASIFLIMWKIWSRWSEKKSAPIWSTKMWTTPKLLKNWEGYPRLNSWTM